MVSVYWPTGAVPPAVTVSVLLSVTGFAEKDAVTSLGRPDTERFTWLANPYWGFTLTKVSSGGSLADIQAVTGDCECGRIDSKNHLCDRGQITRGAGNRQRARTQRS